MAEILGKMTRHIHFVGIGGIGMSGIAQLFRLQGARVSGSDIRDNRNTAELKKMGASVFIGHSFANIAGADLIVYSSAIKDDNPEIIAAKKEGIPLLRRAEALALLMRDKAVITVAGSHGKTTTTSLASYLMLEAGLCPTAAIGGILMNINANACMGRGRFFVAEADESDGSFLYYTPKYSIITNIDREHLDYYVNFENEVEAFRKFIFRTDPSGCVFCCSDDAYLKNIMKDYGNRYVFFGLRKPAQIYPQNIEMKGVASEFDCFYKDKFIARFRLALAGMHNISNALSVIALGLELGINLEIIKKILRDYKGAGRRIEIKFESQELLIIDDYAHHPTEIKATLTAVKNIRPGRVIAIFQPHRFSRTQLLLDEFGKSFEMADYVIVTDIYPAAEAPIDGVSGKRVYEKIKEYAPGKEARFLPKEQIAGYVMGMIKPLDTVITLGAGDIVKVNDELVERIKGKR
ncbi:MAG: UDP-N-acetylmuramate--L-alanine ligase [Deltaproteobacteria bacterium]